MAQPCRHATTDNRVDMLLLQEMRLIYALVVVPHQVLKVTTLPPAHAPAYSCFSQCGEDRSQRLLCTNTIVDEQIDHWRSGADFLSELRSEVAAKPCAWHMREQAGR